MKGRVGLAHLHRHHTHLWTLRHRHYGTLARIFAHLMSVLVLQVWRLKEVCERGFCGVTVEQWVPTTPPVIHPLTLSLSPPSLLSLSQTHLEVTRFHNTPLHNGSLISRSYILLWSLASFTFQPLHISTSTAATIALPSTYIPSKPSKGSYFSHQL